MQNKELLNFIKQNSYTERTDEYIFCDSNLCVDYNGEKICVPTTTIGAYGKDVMERLRQSSEYSLFYKLSDRK